MNISLISRLFLLAFLCSSNQGKDFSFDNNFYQSSFACGIKSSAKLFYSLKGYENAPERDKLFYTTWLHALNAYYFLRSSLELNEHNIAMPDMHYFIKILMTNLVLARALEASNADFKFVSMVLHHTLQLAKDFIHQNE